MKGYVPAGSFGDFLLRSVVDSVAVRSRGRHTRRASGASGGDCHNMWRVRIMEREQQR